MFQLVAAVLTLVAVSSAARVYPCAATPTQECYANYLATVAGCVPPTELPASNVWPAPDAKVEMGYFQLTINRYDTTAEVVHDFEDFILYYDTDAEATVLSTTFQSAKLSGRAEVQYHRLGKQDVLLDTEWSIIFNNIRYTSIYKGVEEITIGSARNKTEIVSFSLDLDSDFAELEAALAADTTGVIAAAQKLFEEHRDIYLRELEPATGDQVWKPFFANFLCSEVNLSALDRV